MSTEVASLHASVSAKMDQAINALRDVKSEFDKAGNSAERMETKVKKSESIFSAMGGLINNINQPIFYLTENLQKLGEVAVRTFQFLKQGATGLELRGAFISQIEDTGVALDTYLNRLQQASGGTVSDMNLMQSASKAMSLGVTDDVNEMASLLEIARFKARKFGTDVATAFEDISVGVGRQSKLILDNLGIVVDTDQAYADYAQAVGKSVSALTDLERKQAFLNAVLQEGQQEITDAGGLLDTQADKFRQVEAAVQDATEAIAAYNAAQADFGGAAEVLESVAGYFRQAAEDAQKLETVRDILKDIGAGDLAGRRDLDQLVRISEEGGDNGLRHWLDGKGLMDEYRLALEDVRAQGAITEQQFYQLAYGVDNLAGYLYRSQMGLDAQTASALALQDAQHHLRTNITLVSDEMDRSSGVGNVLDNVLILLGDAAAVAGAGFDRARAHLNTLTAAMSGAIGIAGALGGALNRLASARAASSPEFALQSALTDLNNARNALGSSTSLTGRINALAGVQEAQNAVREAEGVIRDEHQRTVDEYESGQAAMARAAEKAGNEAEAAAKKAAREAERASEEVQRAWERAVGEVRSAVSSSLDLSINVGAHDEIMRAMGLQGEAVNEAGRRLQDVINRGLESPWVSAFEELRGKTNDEVKATAAYMQQQIEQFLRPDLINVEAAYEKAKNRLVGQRNRDALVEQITQRLVAEGYAIVEAQKAAAEQLGATVPEASAQGGADMVNAVVQSTRETLAGKETELYDLGRATARPYLQGIMDETMDSDLPSAIVTTVLQILEQTPVTN